MSFVKTEAPAPVFELRPDLLPTTAFGLPAQPKKTSDAMSFAPIIYVGFNSGGGGGFAVGGGVEGSNLAHNANFGLNIDGLFSNAGGCPGCGSVGFSAHQITIAAAFIYWFNEMTSGWHPFAGGGIAFSRYSYSFSNSANCTVGGVNFCASSASSTGLQIQGGLEKSKIHLEGRVQPSYGGAFLFLFGYKLGGK